MHNIRTKQDIKQLGTILCVWAHPDDESFCCAGIMAAAVENAQRVVCVTATKGEAGVQNPKRWPPEQLGAIRDVEMRAALTILGVREHHWLGYADGGCQDIPKETGVQRIAAYIEQVQPDSILTFGPDGMTGHPDHQAVSAWATIAGQQAGVAVYHKVEDTETYETYLKAADEKLDIYFNIDKPPLRNKDDCALCFCLDKKLLAKKCDALKAMPSQTEVMFSTMPASFFSGALGYECFVLA